MPSCFDVLGYVVFFWSNEGSPQEPIHVHVAKRISPNATKIWILSDGSALLEGQNPSRIPQHKLNQIVRAIEAYSSEIKEMWKNTFGVEPTYWDKQSPS